MEKQNLVVLRYSKNICTVEVITLKQALAEDPNLQLIEKENSWTHKMLRLEEKRSFKIGNESRYFGQGSRGEHDVIGIYDKTKITHLSSMASKAISSTTHDDFTSEY